MYHSPSKNQLVVRRLATILLMSVSVAAVVFVLLGIVMGYNFNQSDGRIEQGGLLQVGSLPLGATATVDGQVLPQKTRTKINLFPGQHTLSMEREGYHAWQKSVEVQAGKITWAVYPRLIPTTLSVQPVASFSTLADGLPSGDRKWYAFLESEESPNLTVLDLSSDDVKSEKIIIPAGTFANPKKSRSHHFTLESWSASNKKLLVSHTYSDEKGKKAKEWLLLDRAKAEEAVSVSSIAGVSVQDAQFGDGDGRIIFLKVNNAVHRLDVGAKKLSRPLVNDIARFSVWNNETVVYVARKTDDNQSIGYTRENFKEPIELLSQASRTGLANAVIGKYFDTYYLAVSGDSSGALYSIKDLSDSRSSGDRLTKVTDVMLGREITSVSISPNSQFAMWQDGIHFITYNLELGQTLSADIAGASDIAPQKIRLLDSYLYWGIHEGKLRTYEYDGGYQHHIMSFDPKFKATLSASDKYLYAVDKTKDGYTLQRAKLINE